MRYHVFVLLGSFNWEESTLDEAIFFLYALASFLRGKLAVDAHQPSASTDFLVLPTESIVETSKQVDDAFLVRLRSYVQEDDEFGLEVSAEALEEPEVGGQFGAVEMLEAGEQL